MADVFSHRTCKESCCPLEREQVILPFQGGKITFGEVEQRAQFRLDVQRG